MVGKNQWFFAMGFKVITYPMTIARKGEFLMKRNILPAFWKTSQWKVLLGVNGQDGSPSFMWASWYGLYENCQIYLLLDRKSLALHDLKRQKSFTVHPLTKKWFPLLEEDMNEKKEAHLLSLLHVEQSLHLHAPVIEEAPLCFECELQDMAFGKEQVYLKGNLLHILAEDSILVDGKIDPSLFQPLCEEEVQILSHAPLPWWKRWFGKWVG